MITGCLVVLMCFTMQNEAGSRLSINEWLFALMDLCLQMKIKVLLLPELHLSQAADTPAEVKSENFVTFITGSTDYGILTLDSYEFDYQTQGTHIYNANFYVAWLNLCLRDF